MDAFSYVSVIFSVVIGLGLSHLLTGIAELVKARRRIKFYWVHALWVALTFLGHIFLWWTMWNLRLLRNWNFFSFLLILAAPVLLYVAASFMIPKVEPDTRIDLREYFDENRAAFFGLNAAFTALMGMENWLLTGRGTDAIMLAQESKNSYARVLQEEEPAIGFSCPNRKSGQPRPAVTSRLGDVTKKALKLPRPKYRQAMRAARASGNVRVEVVISINTGEVVWARVATGHPLLRDAVEDVACGARFSPTYDVDGRVSGVLTYKIEGLR